MIEFEFSMNVIPRVIDELSEAEQYIRIAIFQLHHPGVFDVLNRKLANGVKVELFTLPYDSINENVLDRVTLQYIELEKNGASLYFCRWNIGDPKRTSTATGRWYSFHGKFIVTDKCAISMTANFTDQNELDALLIYRGEQEKIVEFNQKFDELLDLFWHPNKGYSGKIRSLIERTDYPHVAKLFQQPKVIQTDIHEHHWILDYPAQLCPENLEIEDKLFLCPFDIRGRNIIQKLIQNANTFLYLSTESFTDQDISNDLIKAKLSGLDVKILAGATSMDFNDRIQRMLRGLVASGIKIHTTENPLHGKVIITDHVLAIGSINLNKINLGFGLTSGLWRENTETITLSSDIKIIESAKKQFDGIFSQSVDIVVKLAERIEKDVTKLFIHYFGLNSKQEVKELFSRFILHGEIDVKVVTLKIGKIISSLMGGRNKVNKNDFIKALILHILSDNKLKYNQIEQSLSLLNTQIDLGQILFALIIDEYIEKEDDYYKLRVLSLF